MLRVVRGDGWLNIVVKSDNIRGRAELGLGFWNFEVWRLGWRWSGWVLRRLCSTVDE